MAYFIGEKVYLDREKDEEKRKYLEEKLFVSENDIDMLKEKCHPDVYSLLGLHYIHYKEEMYIMIRCFIDCSVNVKVNSLQSNSSVFIDNVEMDLVRDTFYVLLLKIKKKNLNVFYTTDKYCYCRYELHVTYNDKNMYTYIDPYQFHSLLLEEDLKKFATGSHWFIDKILGSHELMCDGIKGIRFAVWAVQCINITLVGDFNLWNRNNLFMRRRAEYNVFEIFVPFAKKGDTYGYNIIHKENGMLKEIIKIDPYAQMFEVPPKINAIISTCDDDYRENPFQWEDQEWIQRRNHYIFGDTKEEHWLRTFKMETKRETKKEIKREIKKETKKETKKKTMTKTEASRESSTEEANTNDNIIHINGQPELKEIPFEQRKNIYKEPIIIYEMHLGSWKRGQNNEYLNFKDIADDLIEHIHKLHCTHVEFLPLHQHPFEGSWGYQISGLYSPYSKLGTPDDLKYLINRLHQNNIGVILDVVLAHFVKDSWALLKYDGSDLYEYSDSKEGDNYQWGTKLFNYKKKEVRCFLLGSVYHWIRTYHIDGIRVDAVSCMLYKSYGKNDGEWVANEYGGNENLEAISLLKELNYVIHKYFTGVITIAEESTSWNGITHVNGLHFDFKWDLGWMNDTLSYMCLPSYERYRKHKNLTFRSIYQHTEQWVLPLSHDEVVLGKGSILDKCSYMNTPLFEKMQNLKVLIAYQISIPGKPLIFMGIEYGQKKEWNHAYSLDWHELLNDKIRQKCFLCICDIIQLKRKYAALNKSDNDAHNFIWTDCDNYNDNIISYIRSYGKKENDILIILNFSGKFYKQYPIGIPHSEQWVEILNTNDEQYSEYSLNEYVDLSFLNNYDKTISVTKGGRYGWEYCLWTDIPPFSAIFLTPKTEKEI